MDALVTGASGFIGTHLVQKLLAEGQTVRVYVRPGSPRAQRMRELDVEFFEGDLADGAALDRAAKGVRTIFHAGSGFRKRGWSVEGMMNSTRTRRETR